MQFSHVLVYSEFDDSQEVRGDEWLPLGPSFQEHLSLYAKYINKHNLIDNQSF